MIYWKIMYISLFMDIRKHSTENKLKESGSGSSFSMRKCHNSWRSYIFYILITYIYSLNKDNKMLFSIFHIICRKHHPIKLIDRRIKILKEFIQHIILHLNEWANWDFYLCLFLNTNWHVYLFSTVCNFMSHEKCLKYVKIPCSSIAPSLVRVSCLCLGKS